MLRFVQNLSGQAFKVTEQWKFVDLVSKEILRFFFEMKLKSVSVGVFIEVSWILNHVPII